MITPRKRYHVLAVDAALLGGRLLTNQVLSIFPLSDCSQVPDRYAQ